MLFESIDRTLSNKCEFPPKSVYFKMRKPVSLITWVIQHIAWWCSGGPVHYELFPAGKTVKADLNCRQLTTAIEKLSQLSGRTTSRSRPCLHHDNAAPYTAKMTKETLESFGFRALPHPPYSPDLAPSDFHLFRSLQWFLRDRTLETEEECPWWFLCF